MTDAERIEAIKILLKVVEEYNNSISTQLNLNLVSASKEKILNLIQTW